jgi:hypothetical protein
VGKQLFASSKKQQLYKQLGSLFTPVREEHFQNFAYFFSRRSASHTQHLQRGAMSHRKISMPTTTAAESPAPKESLSQLSDLLEKSEKKSLFASRSEPRLLETDLNCGTCKAQPKPGVDVMITIFGDFSQFSAKKIGVFLKYQCYDQLFSKFSFVLSQKTPIFLQNFFAKFFGENIFKVITSVPACFGKIFKTALNGAVW